MVSTVFHKRQFAVVELTDDDFQQLTKRNSLILFPLMNEKHVNYVSDLISSKVKRSLVSEIKENGAYTLNLVIKRQRYPNIIRIEHVIGNFFRFITEDSGVIVTDSFKLTCNNE